MNTYLLHVINTYLKRYYGCRRTRIGKTGFFSVADCTEYCNHVFMACNKYVFLTCMCDRRTRIWKIGFFSVADWAESFTASTPHAIILVCTHTHTHTHTHTCKYTCYTCVQSCADKFSTSISAGRQICSILLYYGVPKRDLIRHPASCLRPKLYIHLCVCIIYIHISGRQGIGIRLFT